MRGLEHELTSHAAALRGLARVLVGEQQADDLVQDTALQLLAAPPPRLAGLFGWLAAVLRHRASKHHRGERRRQRRERASPPPDPVATPSHLAEHKETLQRLTAALTSLPEPYLGTLLLRFFEDLQPGAIAARTGVPLATVKSRLQRGLATLRAQLAARDAHWRPALGAVFGGVFGSSAAPIATTTAGVLFMGSASKLAVGAAVLAVAATLWFGREAVFGATAGRTDAHDGAPLAAAALERSPARDVATQPDAPGALRTGSERELAAADVTLRGRVVDERGLPLAGCAVALSGHRVTGGVGKDFAREYSDWLVRGGRPSLDRETTTGSGGAFTFVVEPSPLNLGLSLRRDRLDWRLSIGQMLRSETRDLGDLCVPCSCVVRVRVRDTAGAELPAPVVSIRPAARDPNARNVPWADFTEPEVGADWLLAAGTWQCSVGRTIERGEQFVVPPGAAVFDHEIVVGALPPAQVLAGLVVDEHDLPVPGVALTAWNGVTSAGTRTRRDGRFALLQATSGGPDADLSLDKRGFEPQRIRVRFGDPELRLTLRASSAIVVHVVADADGAPVEDFCVRRWWDVKSDPVAFVDEGKELVDGHHEGGVAVVEDIARGDHLLIVEPLRLDLWRSDAVPVAVTPGGPVHVEVRLQAAANRLVRVQRGDETPVRAAAIDVADAGTMLGQGMSVVTLEHWSPRTDRDFGPLLLHQTSTDASGEAMLRGPAGRAVRLRVTCKGLPQLIPEPMRLDDPEPLVLTLPAAARLVVHVHPPAMVQLLREACGLSREGPAPRRGPNHKPGFRLFRGAWLEREMLPPSREPPFSIAGDGTVVIDEAPAGDWQLGLDAWHEVSGTMFSWGAPVLLAPVALREGVTTEIELDLGDHLPGELDGTVTCNGELVADAAIAIEVERPTGEFPWPGRFLLNAKTDAEGRFHLRMPPGSLRVAIDRTAQHRAPLGGGSYSYQLVYADQQLQLTAGSAVQATFAVEPCTLRLRVLDERGEPVAGVPLLLPGPQLALWHRPAATDAEGCTTCEVEPGTFSVQVLPRRLLADGAQAQFLREHRGVHDALAPFRIRLGDVTAVRGKTGTFELRLPPGW
ncbi:MAG TPA: RNA polymerase sigma factor [Planctomycetota bacterium]|nr:RNA polymerase sigma factor [Planctomycetota bacterium]